MRHVHFVGVSGIGVSAVAGISLEMGMTVSGSADRENDLTRELVQKGMRFSPVHSAGNLQEPDLVVMSAAVPENNPELVEAKRRGIPVMLYSRYLGTLMEGKNSIAVAGTHGKTTTTAMLTSILHRAGLEPSAVCGGIMGGFGSNYVAGAGDCFVAEACEYNRSFHDLRHRLAIVTNIEAEHLDFYRDLEEIREAFRIFVRNAEEGFTVANGDDANVMKALKGLDVVWVGFGESNRWRVQAQPESDGCYRVRITGEGREMETKLPVPGRFNCMNAALSAVCAAGLGVDTGTAESALAHYAGTRRRLEYLGERSGRKVYSDYAHHPTEISAALRALGEKYGEDGICVVFQPHQYSRTAIFFDALAGALASARCAVVVPIYKQRDESGEGVSGRDLAEKLMESMGERAGFAQNLDEAVRFLEGRESCGNVVVFMGAGDIDEWALEYGSAGSGTGG